MKRHTLPIFIAVQLVAALLGGTASGHAQATPQRVVQGLAIQARDGWVSQGEGQALCDLGPLDPLITPEITKNLTLHNAGSALLTIDAVQPTCGCTAVVTDATGKTDSTLTLPPGATTMVRCTLDSTELSPGPFDKVIYILTRGHAGPELTLHLRGVVHAPITYSIPRLDFGRVPAGQSRVLRLSVAWTPEVLKQMPHPHLVSSVPDLQITEMKGPSIGDVTASTPHSYLLTLSENARIGPLNGRIHLANADGSNESAALTSSRPTSVRNAYLTGITLPIVGEVAGHIAALPSLFVFGAVPTGKVAVCRVTLIGRDSGILQGLTLSSSSAYLSARQLGSGNAPSATATAPSGLDPSVPLEAMLSANTPPGDLKAEITVITRTHERLVLPVLVEITAH